MGAAGAYEGLVEGIWAVLLRVGGSGLVPEPGCGRRDGWGPQGWLGELVSPLLCPAGRVGVVLAVTWVMVWGLSGVPPHPEIGSLSLRSQAELGRVCGRDPQVRGGCSSCNC